VIFTSINDDSYGGDTNGDGDVLQPSPADWRGIYLYGYSTLTGRGYFDWCRVRYAGNVSGSVDANVRFNQSDDGYFINSISEYSSLEGLKIDDCSPQITDSEFISNGSHGVHVNGGSSTRPLINDNHFTENTGNAVWLDGTGLISYSGNSGAANGVNGMVLHGSTSSAHSWVMSDPSFPFIIDGTVSVLNGDTLTIPAGTVIKSYEVGELYVSGTLDVNGSEQDPVIFTSINDDTYAGDTNGDGDVSQPLPADWRGLYLYGYSTNRGQGYFEWCRVRYAGNSSGNSDANVKFVQSDSSCFYNSISEFSNMSGIWTENSALHVRNSLIENNISYGVYISGYAMPNLGANDLADRGLNRVRMNNGGVYQIYNSTPHQVPAYYNYWDGETAPEIDALLYDDNENASLGMILFDPWAVALAAPENLVIFYNLDSGIVELSWDAVPEATGYRIYSSTQPYFGFLEDESGLFDGASWTAPASDNVRFYLVRAYN
jgi:hypothetical protein